LKLFSRSAGHKFKCVRLQVGTTEVEMKNRLRWGTASFLVLVMCMLLSAPAAFAAGPRVKSATAASAAVTNAAPARRSIGGWLNNLFGSNYQYQPPRSYKTSAAIIGGSAATGAVVGGLLKGKKGAVIGALAGGAAGWYYDHKTSNR
jgi:hypothetical protein